MNSTDPFSSIQFCRNDKAEAFFPVSLKKIIFVFYFIAYSLTGWSAAAVSFTVCYYY